MGEFGQKRISIYDPIVPGGSGDDQGPGVPIMKTRRRIEPQQPVYVGRRTKKIHKRECLHCETKFEAGSKYFRLCRQCRQRAEMFGLHE